MKRKTPEQEHDEAEGTPERAEGAPERAEGAPEHIPQSTSNLCQNCRVTFMLDDGICPACNPRIIAPGPSPDGG